MAAFLRTRTLGETGGFAKALISAEDDTILGFTAIGVDVGELLPSVMLVSTFLQDLLGVQHLLNANI
jgi:pyruvate/2-oxoglutarate dehydrogenase complex dihydrolipoamide dehydrogenase (E3) component